MSKRDYDDSKLVCQPQLKDPWKIEVKIYRLAGIYYFTDNKGEQLLYNKILAITYPETRVTWHTRSNQTNIVTHGAFAVYVLERYFDEVLKRGLFDEEENYRLNTINNPENKRLRRK